MLNTDWDLSPIYKSFTDKKYISDSKWMQEECRDLTAFVSLGFSSNDWLVEVIKRLNKLYGVYQRISQLSSLTLSVDSTDEVALSEMNRVDVFGVEINKLINLLYRKLELISDIDSIIESDEYLKQFRFVIHEMRDDAKHMLSESIEDAVLSMQLTGGKAWANLRNMLDGTAMVEYMGEKLPLAKVRSLADDKDPKVRKDAYEAELAAYTNYEIPMAACLNAIKGEAITITKFKGFETVLDYVLNVSRMDKQTLEAMLNSMEKYLPKFRQYLKAKAKYLGYSDGLPFYDLFAPLGNATSDFTYDEAHDYLVTVLSKFSKEMSDFVDHAFKNRWIDALPKQGKGGGAFCSSIGDIKESRILSNFTGSFSDVSTLAHELGHAYHSYCLNDDEIINTNYPMPLAETASIFNELLVSQSALTEADEDMTFAILEAELMEATQVIVDIYSRYLFETELFSKRADTTLSVEELKTMMLDAQKKAYGDGLNHDILHPYMWQNKVHYYITDLHFYNFPYAFGLLFAHGVFAQYMQEGSSFKDKYNMLLRATGTNSVADTAMKIGINVRTSDFWDESLENISKAIDRFVKIVDDRLK